MTEIQDWKTVPHLRPAVGMMVSIDLWWLKMTWKKCLEQSLPSGVFEMSLNSKDYAI